MAITVDRAKARLKVKASNLSNIRIDEFSARLASKIKDDATDEEVDEAIKDYDEIINFADIARNDDKIRQLEAKPKPIPEVKKTEETVIETDPMKLMLKTIQDLAEEVKGFKAEKSRESVGSKFANDERVKDIPEIIRKGFTPTSDEDYEAKVEALVAEYTPYAEKLKLAGFTGEDNPQSSTGGADAKAGTVKAKSMEETKSLADSI